ncbi:putative membrane protein YbfM [Robertmurraya siralis]|uniref:Membrane protein YbfM n=1 Tax=Robertmurraya siralis TaxID=77777 RepID=A0A920BTN3_9BACI|nr:DedA family protein [Robertmurraya siralis]PAE20044.1 DedA family protein [Bacillus sp. 7504-2]GIN62044.1 putative membrane protein YbfM [Robertmurraya siralis]
MELDFILDLIESSGYLGLFLWLWLGVFGAPLPNELIVMTIGIAASQAVLNPIAAFLVTFGGIVAALTTAYLLGRFVGSPLLPFLKKRKRFSKVIERSLNVMNKYHSYSLTMSYFIPGLRNFVPFLYGVSKLSFKTFMLFAYSGAFVWLIIMFSLGYWFGDHKERIFQMETELLLIVAVLTTSYFILKLIKRKRKQKIKSMT